ncbi:MAG: glycosyltransferase family 39 protein [Anaerolineae bacterium]
MGVLSRSGIGVARPVSQVRPQFNWRWALALLAVIVAALAVRLPTLGYGLPHIYYGDERYLVLPALKVAQTGNFNPDRLDYGSLFIYLLAGVDWIASHVGILPPLGEMALVPYSATYYPMPTLYLVGRSLSLGFSLLAVVGVFLLAQQTFDRPTAVLAGTLLALSPLTAIMSRYAVTDSLLQALAMFALYAMMRLYERVSWQRVVLAGALVGLAASAKYPGILLVLPLVAAILLSRNRSALILALVGSLAAAAAAFLVTTPFAILDYAKFQIFAGIAQSEHLARSILYTDGPSWQWYLGSMLAQGDRLFLLLGVPAATLFAVRRPREAVVLLLFPATLFVVMCSGGVRSLRYSLPIIAILAVFSAWLLTLFVARLPSRHRWFGYVAVAACLIMLLGSTILDIQTLRQPDARELAAQWVRDNAGNMAIISDDMALADDPFLPRIEHVTSLTDHPAAWYAERGYLVVVSDFRWTDPNRTIEQENLQRAFEADPSLEIVAHLRGQMWGIPGYGVRIFRPRPQ